MEVTSHPVGDSGVDYLVLSDVHLGSDIVPHLRPWARTSWLTEEPEIDRRLEAMLVHHRRALAPSRRLRLVIAGDFLELVGVSLPTEGVRTAPSREERHHGLGSASDHVVAKIEAIARRHARAFRSLFELLREGHELALVHGNHDIELHWQAARRAFVEAVVAHAEPDERDPLRARISFHPWFYLAPGLLYIEHGHHFDAMCSYGDPLLPTCPRDARRIRQVPFSILLRNVARPTRGLSSASYEHAGFGAYLHLLTRLGVRESLRIALRFATAAVRLVREWTVYVRGESARRRHARRLVRARFAARARVAPQLLAAMECAYAAPATSSLTMVLRSLYLDRVFALLFTIAAVFGCALAGLARFDSEVLAYAIPALLGGTYAGRARDRGIHPRPRMLRGAQTLADLFGVRWVIMGHTHDAEVHTLAGGARYVNLGHWGEDDVPEERATSSSPRAGTYLYVYGDGADGHEASLLRWSEHCEPVLARRAEEREHCGVDRSLIAE